MKKTIFVLIFLLIMLQLTAIFATDGQSINNSNIERQEESTSTSGELIEIKSKTEKELQDYIDSYGTESYGFTAYILNKVRIYSIPACFIGIAVAAIFQYVIGVRRLDVRYKGFYTIIAFITILVICQILPLIFAIVVKGWRG